jgi:hypothetical protein
LGSPVEIPLFQLLLAKPPNLRVRAPIDGCQRQDRRPINLMLITDFPGALGAGQLEDMIHRPQLARDPTDVVQAPLEVDVFAGKRSRRSSSGSFLR